MRLQASVLLLFILTFHFVSCSKQSNDQVSKTDTNKTSSTTNQSASPQSNQPPPSSQNQTGTVDPITLVGNWVNPDNNMGFTLNKDGKAASINMATLDYRSWKVEGKNLILNSKSKGVSNPVEVDEVYIVKTITPYKLVISPADNPGTVYMFARK